MNQNTKMQQSPTSPGANRHRLFNASVDEEQTTGRNMSFNVRPLEAWYKVEVTPLAVKAPIHYLDGGKVVVIEAPVMPGMRAQELLSLVQAQSNDSKRSLELWSYPREHVLCEFANVYELVTKHQQQLQLRPRPGFWTRMRMRNHDSECDCHPKSPHPNHENQ